MDIGQGGGKEGGTSVVALAEGPQKVSGFEGRRVRGSGVAGVRGHVRPLGCPDQGGHHMSCFRGGARAPRVAAGGRHTRGGGPEGPRGHKTPRGDGSARDVRWEAAVVGNELSRCQEKHSELGAKIRSESTGQANVTRGRGGGGSQAWPTACLPGFCMRTETWSPRVQTPCCGHSPTVTQGATRARDMTSIRVTSPQGEAACLEENVPVPCVRD